MRSVSADSRNETTCSTDSSTRVSLIRNAPRFLLQRANSSPRVGSKPTGPWKPSSNCNRSSRRSPSMRIPDTQTPTSRSSPPPAIDVSETSMSIPVNRSANNILALAAPTSSPISIASTKAFNQPASTVASLFTNATWS